MYASQTIVNALLGALLAATPITAITSALNIRDVSEGAALVNLMNGTNCDGVEYDTFRVKGPGATDSDVSALGNHPFSASHFRLFRFGHRPLHAHV